MSATYGIPGTATYSLTFNSLDEMLASVPNNNTQIIGATSVRNSLFTVWQEILDTQALFYSNLGATTASDCRRARCGPGWRI